MHDTTTHSSLLGGRRSLSSDPVSTVRGRARSRAVGEPERGPTPVARPVSDAAPAALGINRDFAAPAASVSSTGTESTGYRQPDPAAVARLERFEAQAFARKLLPRSYVGICLRYQLTGRVGVHHSSSKQSAKYSGLARCGLSWICPCCAAATAEVRRQEIQAAIDAWRNRGGAVLLATLTFAHNRNDQLSSTLSAVLAAFRSMTGNKRYKAIKAVYGLKHYIRATEITWGNAYGFHPHFHCLVFVGGDVDRGALEQDLFVAWQQAAALHGLDVGREHGVNLKLTTDGVDSYVSKWGRNWTAADELAKSNVKRGRHEHYSPFDLLRLAAAGKRWAAFRFREYAESTRGVSQLRWSRGLRGAVGLVGKELSDAEAAALIEDDAVLLALLDAQQWNAVKRFHQRGQLLEVARSGDAEVVQAFVDGLVRRSQKVEARSSMSNRKKIKGRLVPPTKSPSKVDRDVAEIFFGVGEEPLTDELVAELVRRGWERDKLDELRRMGARYSRPRDSIIMAGDIDDL